MAYSFCYSLALGTSKVGLTVASQLVDITETNVGSEITTLFSEVGNGNYLWYYDGFPDNFRGGIKFYKLGFPNDVLAFVSVNPEEGEYVKDLIETNGTIIKVSNKNDNGSFTTGISNTGDNIEIKTGVI